MHNQISKYLCHMNSQEKAAYNRDYYRRNKDYWVKWRKEHSAPLSSPAALKAWENAQKSNRPDYAKLESAEKLATAKYDAAALSSAKKQNWAYAEGMRRKERSKQLASDLGKNQAALSGWDAIDTANRIAAKKRGKKTPVASVNLEDLANERNMSKIAKTVRSVKRSLRSASEAFKGDWQRGASDLIKLGKQIKDAWCNN